MTESGAWISGFVEIEFDFNYRKESVGHWGEMDFPADIPMGETVDMRKTDSEHDNIAVKRAFRGTGIVKKPRLIQLVD